MVDICEVVPRAIHEELVWLGNVKNWCSIYADAPTEQGAITYAKTAFKVDWQALLRAGFERQPVLSKTMTKIYNDHEIISLFYLEAASYLLANGPKLFQPTVEQFESMRQVKLLLKPSEFRSPYPAIVIGVPNDCRHALAEEYGFAVKHIASQVLVRQKIEGSGLMAVLVCVPYPGLNSEQHYIFTDQPHNPDIECVLNRYINQTADELVIIENPEPEVLIAGEIARACLNLCLLLAHCGCQVTGPLDPEAYKKHRRKKNLEKFKHGDYLSVEMKQHIVVRAPTPPTLNPPSEDGSGVEMKPHWRKGHWRAYPGKAALRAAGEKVPLLFVRPVLVRKDRVVGELSQTETVYKGS